MKLFAVYLGGQAPQSNTELHDVVFAIGEHIEDTYPQLKEKWFGDVNSLHMDAYLALETIDGFEISISKEKPNQDQRLYFVNLGGYRPGAFNEIHENFFVVAPNAPLAKKKAKEKASCDLITLHKDYVLDVDDCIEIQNIDTYHVHLAPTDKPENTIATNGYFKIP